VIAARAPGQQQQTGAHTAIPLIGNAKMSKFPGLDRDAANVIARQVLEARRAELLAPQLSDTTPPVEPPTVPPVASDPVPHRVSAWRHGGSMANSVHSSLEHARMFAATLSADYFWKYAIVRIGAWPTVVETKPIGG
jgi:hypothetical protein